MIKKQLAIFISILLLGSFLLSACGSSLEETISYISPEPQTWIDAPLHKSTIPLAPYEIIMHATDATDIHQFEISIDNTVVAVVEPSMQNGLLHSASLVWQPANEGVHYIKVRSKNISNTWSNAATADVTVDGDFVYLTPPPEVEDTLPPTLTFTPEATETLTPTITATEKVCPVLPAIHLIEPLNGFNIYQNQQTGISWQSLATMDGCGAASTRFQFASDVNFNSVLIDQSGLAPDGSYSYTTNFSCGTYYWRILSYRADNSQAVSETRSINILCPTTITPVAAPQTDSQSPAAFLSYSPNNPNSEKQVTISAQASDNIGVTRIEIFLQKSGENQVLAKACSNASTCEYTSYISWGTYNVWAYAYDQAGNRGQSKITRMKVDEVIK